jgi:hypothetical protein
MAEKTRFGGFFIALKINFGLILVVISLKN